MDFPLWATPERRAYLVELFLKDPLACEIDLFTGKLVNPFAEELIVYWKADDRDASSYLWQLERRRLHAAPHRHFPRVRTSLWDSITREEYLVNRPLWRIEAIGVGALTHKRVAKVEIPELKATLWVDLSGMKLEGTSKHKLRKLARRGGAVPKGLVDQIENRCAEAVRRYLG